jgi:hypothetical protein
MHNILEMYDLIASRWSDRYSANTDLSYFYVSSKAYSAFSQSPADEVRLMQGNIVTVPLEPSVLTSVLGFCCGATCPLTSCYDCDQYDRGVGLHKFDNSLFV